MAKGQIRSNREKKKPKADKNKKKGAPPAGFNLSRIPGRRDGRRREKITLVKPVLTDRCSKNVFGSNMPQGMPTYRIPCVFSVFALAG